MGVLRLDADPDADDVGGMFRLAKTQVERHVSGDPRLSPEVLCGTRAGKMAAPAAAAANAVAKGFLLQADAVAPIAEALR